MTMIEKNLHITLIIILTRESGNPVLSKSWIPACAGMTIFIMSILKTEAIVLRSFDFRETSRIATFYTKEYGRGSGSLKRIRQAPKKFGSSLDRFSVNDIVYYQCRNSELHLISHCDMRNYFYPVRQDLKKSIAAHYIMELVNVIMPTEEKNAKVYQLMVDFLSALEKTDDINKLIHFFQIKILLISGFKPHLDTCLHCHKKIGGKARFSLKDGGLICLECPVADTTVHLISPGAVASILFAEKNDWTHCLKLKLTSVTKDELKYVLNNFLVFHLGRKIKSAKYL